MRKDLSLDLLVQFVYLICDGLDSFSAYDITSMLRSRLPGYEVNHSEVKNCVVSYVKANNMVGQIQHKNGTSYMEYTKSNSFLVKVKQTTNVPNVTPSVKQVSYATNAQVQALLNNNKPTANNNQYSLKALLRSEGRITLPEQAKNVVSKMKNPSIRKESNRIVILDGPKAGFEKLSSSRFRTGFKSKEVKVVVHNTWVEILPQ